MKKFMKVFAALMLVVAMIVVVGCGKKAQETEAQDLAAQSAALSEKMQTEMAAETDPMKKAEIAKKYEAELKELQTKGEEMAAEAAEATEATEATEAAE